jgi:hypothetical protein
MSSPFFDRKYSVPEADSNLTERNLVDSGLLDALSGFDADSNLAIVQRTRRAVMAAAHQLKAARLKRRRQVGIMLVTFFGLLILMTPALWSVTDDVFADEHFFDMPAMTMSIVLTLLSTLFAALILHWRSRHVRDEEKY